MPSFRVLAVIDQWNRESVSLATNFRPTARWVGKDLDKAAIERGWPCKVIRVDNGTEFTSKALGAWCEARLRAAWKARRQCTNRVVQWPPA